MHFCLPKFSAGLRLFADSPFADSPVHVYDKGTGTGRKPTGSSSSVGRTKVDSLTGVRSGEQINAKNHQRLMRACTRLVPKLSEFKPCRI